jgi:hypothetical protein
MFAPLEIKQQLSSDFCVSCVIASIAEEYLGETCEESFTQAFANKYSGQKPVEWGLNAKQAIMSAIEYGVLPKSKSPYSLRTHSQEFLEDWRNWKDVMDFAVKPFRSFRKVRNIEKALERGSVQVGLYWQGQWDDNAIIPIEEDFHKFEPHEVRIIGIKDNMYIIQNSRGEKIGDKGLFYIPKEMKKVIRYAYQLSDKPWSNFIQKLITIYL